MMTTTHILMGAALASRPRLRPVLIAMGWAGGLFPDLSIFVLFVHSRLAGISGDALWSSPDGLYWRPGWQIYISMSHSLPLWLFLCAIGFFLMRRVPSWRVLGTGLLIFSAAALAHSLVDFMVHASDAHMEFLPFSTWRFHSPFSYWERDHYGRIVSLIETALGGAMVIYLFRRTQSLPVRVLVVLMALPYGVNLFFHLHGTF